MGKLTIFQWGKLSLNGREEKHHWKNIRVCSTFSSGVRPHASDDLFCSRRGVVQGLASFTRQIGIFETKFQTQPESAYPVWDWDSVCCKSVKIQDVSWWHEKFELFAGVCLSNVYDLTAFSGNAYCDISVQKCVDTNFINLCNYPKQHVVCSPSFHTPQLWIVIPKDAPFTGLHLMFSPQIESVLLDVEIFLSHYTIQLEITWNSHLCLKATSGLSQNKKCFFSVPQDMQVLVVDENRECAGSHWCCQKLTNSTVWWKQSNRSQALYNLFLTWKFHKLQRFFLCGLFWCGLFKTPISNVRYTVALKVQHLALWIYMHNDPNYQEAHQDKKSRKNDTKTSLNLAASCGRHLAAICLSHYSTLAFGHDIHNRNLNQNKEHKACAGEQPHVQDLPVRQLQKERKSSQELSFVVQEATWVFRQSGEDKEILWTLLKTIKTTSAVFCLSGTEEKSSSSYYKVATTHLWQIRLREWCQGH